VTDQSRRPTTLPHPSDLKLLGATMVAEHRLSFPLTLDVARHDGALYGGTAIAASVVGMEAVTARDALWVTTQYATQAELGDTIDCDVVVHSSGRHLSQFQVTGRLGDRVLFVSLGATAVPRPGGLEGQYEEMPKVTGPEQGLAMSMGAPVEAPPAQRKGLHSVIEYRVAECLDDPSVAPPMGLWARLAGGSALTRAGMAFLADMVPPAIARAAGFAGGGFSLDNSLRFGTLPDDVEWVLLELRGHMSTGAHGHGTVKVWTEDGRLVGVGGQSANMRFAFAPPPGATPDS
jgi:acyl-CoA thioesterase-2